MSDTIETSQTALNASFVSTTVNLPEHIDKANLLNTPVLHKSSIKQWLKADELMARTQAQCADMLSATEQKVAEAVAQAEQQVFKNANDLLTHWQKQGEQQLESLTPAITEIVLASLKQLLFNLPEEQVLQVLAQQIQQAKGTLAKGNVYCHPSVLSALEQVLSAQSNNVWELHPDSNIEPSELRLEDAQGAYQASVMLSIEAIAKINS